MIYCPGAAGKDGGGAGRPADGGQLSSPVMSDTGQVAPPSVWSSSAAGNSSGLEAPCRRIRAGTAAFQKVPFFIRIQNVTFNRRGDD